MSRRHFLVVGAQRSGTTWLHDQLAGHPQIAMARPARPEPKVFLSPDPVDAADYRARYFGHAGAEDLLGEKSTSYLESPTAPASVAAALGEARIVVQLRDPVARAVSNWSFSRDHGVETRPLAEALLANLDGAPDGWDPGSSSVSPFAYLERGRYADDLVRWHDRFPVHVQFLEEVLTDTARIAELFAWLGVADDVRPDVDAAVNASTTDAEELDPDLEARLRDYFADSDAALARMLGRDLPWTDRQA